MAVPRTKVTKSKRGMRRSTDFLKSQAYVEDKSTTLYKLKFENDIVREQEVIFEDRIGRIRDLEVNSKGELFLIDSSGSASLWELKHNGGIYE